MDIVNLCYIISFRKIDLLLFKRLGLGVLSLISIFKIAMQINKYSEFKDLKRKSPLNTEYWLGTEKQSCNTWCRHLLSAVQNYSRQIVRTSSQEKLLKIVNAASNPIITFCKSNTQEMKLTFNTARWLLYSLTDLFFQSSSF